MTFACPKCGIEAPHTFCPPRPPEIRAEQPRQPKIEFVGELAFVHSAEGRDWARAFVRFNRANPLLGVDEDVMTGWFQQAIDKGKAAASPLPAPRQDSPRIVCLCGSTRFYTHFQEANYQETMAGRIVLSVGFYPHAQKEMHHSEDLGCSAEQKIKLDELHKRKIDLADEILVLNVGGYIGSSTRSEIDHAVATGKPIRYLEPATSPVLSEPEK